MVMAVYTISIGTDIVSNLYDSKRIHFIMITTTIALSNLMGNANADRKKTIMIRRVESTDGEMYNNHNVRVHVPRSAHGTSRLKWLQGGNLSQTVHNQSSIAP